MPKTDNSEKKMMSIAIKVGLSIILLLIGTMQAMGLRNSERQEKTMDIMQTDIRIIREYQVSHVWKDSLWRRDFNDLNERVQVLEDERP